MVAEMEQVQIMDKTPKTAYVAGFFFEGDKVALIRKARPEWQKGRLNGIGGKIESTESPERAMVREFEEETGARTSITQWWPFAVLTGENFVVHFFSTYGNLSLLRSTTDEEVVVLPVADVTVYNSIPNLTWLLPMARSIPYESTHTFYIQEKP